MDDDLAMFGQPRLSIENLDSAFRYRLKKLARVVRGEHITIEEPSAANSPQEGEENPHEEVSGAEARSDDDDDAYTPDSVSGSVTGGNRVSEEDEDEYEEGEPGDGQDRHPDDEGVEPEITTSDPTLEDPYHQLSGAGNAKAKESDLEAHRK